MSFWTSAIEAAKIAVKAPTIATVFIAVGASTKTAFERVTMYTPAVTIVAAWMRADTGVGPSIASGNQTYSGICALLPVAPTKSSRQMTESTPKVIDSIGIVAAAFWMARKSNVPKVM